MSTRTRSDTVPRHIAARTAFSSLLALGLVACHGGSTPPDPAAARTDLEHNLAPREVRLMTPELREEHPTVSLVGDIRAFDTVMVAAEVAGRVEQVQVEVGDHVTAGQPMVQIDRETYRLRLQQAEADLAAAKANLELAERALERKRDLLSDNTIPQSSFDEAKASHDLAVARRSAAESAVELARTDAERSVVRAPSDGAVASRHATRGQWADIGTGLIEVAVGGKVKVAAQVPSAWVTSLQGIEGFEFTIHDGETPRHATLYAIAPVINEASRSFEIIGTAPAQGLNPGLFANVHLASPDAVQTLWVPATAVAASDTPRLMQVEDGKTAAIRVQTGRRDDGMVEIVSGLEPGQAIIADIAGLSRDLPVTVVEGP
jgi:membrane fusion protein (multidrug efflux system)